MSKTKKENAKGQKRKKKGITERLKEVKNQIHCICVVPECFTTKQKQWT